jgi:glycosyltransferase involved in cell wall biosynthesis
MHHGCVCLATATGSSPEVGGDAVLYVNPHSVADIARALRRLVELSPKERQRIAEQARKRSAQFTWTRFHDGLAEVLRAEAEPRSRSASKRPARPVAKGAS